MLLAQQDNQVEQESTQSTFVRVEQKHLLPKNLWPALERLLTLHSKPSYLDDVTSFNLIESIYYDSASLKIYNDHFSNRVSRVKVRTRKYAPNGEWKHKAIYLEVKKKADGICTKERARLPFEQATALALGEALEVNERMLKKNKRDEPSVVAERIQFINGLVQDFELRPQARVVYHRQAFEADGFRVTVDNHLKFELLRDISGEVASQIRSSEFWNRALFMRSLFDDGGVMVLELKHSGMIPDWMNDFLVQNSVNKSQFSKYCFAITSSIVEG
ncbi:MAG: polyphosphate polymerase domain-containing protein [Bdellovibrionia bacterium]